jgi:uroporphyrinogen-III synthase
MLACMPWVLTRPAEESKALATELHLEVVPCIERRDLPWPAWPKTPLLFLTSAAVARRLARLTAPRGIRIAALAPATLEAIRYADVTATGGAVALAQAVKAWAKQPFEILYPTSDKGLEQPEQEEAVRILETVGPVHRHAVYETRAPEGLAAALKRHAGRDFIFYSPSAVVNFVAAKGAARRALCVGASTARAWREAGQGELLLATVETVKKVLLENP